MWQFWGFLHQVRHAHLSLALFTLRGRIDGVALLYTKPCMLLGPAYRFLCILFSSQACVEAPLVAEKLIVQGCLTDVRGDLNLAQSARRHNQGDLKPVYCYHLYVNLDWAAGCFVVAIHALMRDDLS